MAKATKQIKRVARRRTVSKSNLAPASLTVSPPELGSPQLGQINRLGVARSPHRLTAASLPGAAPDFGFAEDPVAPQAAAPPAPKLPTGPQSARIATAVSELYPNGLPSEKDVPNHVLARKIETRLKWSPHRRTITRYLEAVRCNPAV
jgi:hypothetical protein